jgi:integrase
MPAVVRSQRARTTVLWSPGKWRIRIETGVGPDGKRLFRYETVSGTEDDAQRRRFAILNEHDEGSFVSPDKVTFGRFFAHWLDTRLALKQISRSTKENYEKMFRYFLQPLAGKRIQRITSQDIQQVYTAMARRGDLSDSTISQVHKVLTVCFKAIRKVKLIKTNVMEEVEAPRRPKVKPKALTEENARALLNVLVGDWLERPVILAFTTGLRRGEVCGLRWGDIDLDRAKLFVRGQFVQYADNSVEWVATKTDAGQRTISLDGETVDMLRQMRIEAAKFRMAAGFGGKLDDAYVFQRPSDGGPVKPSNLTTAIRLHCDKLGFEEFTFHRARHTHLTALLARVGKTGAKGVSQRTGHTNLSTTLSIYQTVFEEDDRALAEITSGMFRGKK